MTVRDIERTLALQGASLALDYPDARLREKVPLLRATADRLSSRVRPLLARFVGYLSGTPPAVLEASYVDTFDLGHRCCPYLTHRSRGDTRDRSRALRRFTEAYRVAGFTLADAEPADHLAVVCEFTARAPTAGLMLFAEHRAPLERLRTALADAGSPYVDVVDLIRGVLPPPPPPQRPASR